MASYTKVVAELDQGAKGKRETWACRTRGPVLGPTGSSTKGNEAQWGRGTAERPSNPEIGPVGPKQSRGPIGLVEIRAEGPEKGVSVGSKYPVRHTIPLPGRGNVPVCPNEHESWKEWGGQQAKIPLICKVCKNKTSNAEIHIVKRHVQAHMADGYARLRP
jgi:hypothetical protein